MFKAQALFSGDETLSPWMERGGNRARFTVDLIDTVDARIEVRMYHKNRDETGGGDPVGPTILLSTVGTGRRTASSLKELVRYHCKCSSTATPQQDYNYVLFRMLALVWFDEVSA